MEQFWKALEPIEVTFGNDADVRLLHKPKALVPMVEAFGNSTDVSLLQA